jgi:hypothetical protein
VFEFRTLDHVASAPKGRNDPILMHAGVATAMIEMQMGIDDEIDLVGSDAGACERID